MKQSLTTAIFLTLTCSLCLVVPDHILSQDQAGVSDAAFSDLVFDEIRLTPDGVTAYDTLGNQWLYDFEAAAFLLADGESNDREAEGRRAPEDVVLPVERRCTEQRRLSDIQRSVLVGYDEYVDGNVVAYGKVTVKGWVKGNVQSYSKAVMVTESGQVDGDIRAPSIIIKRGGVVYGKQIKTEPMAISVDMVRDQFSANGIWVVFSFLLFFVLAGFLSVSLAPRQVRVMEDCISRHRARSLLVGLLFLFLMPILAAILAVTIVGILLIPFLPLAYLLALTAAMISTGVQICRQWFNRSAKGEARVLFQAFIGIAFYMILWITVAVLLGSADEVSQGFGIFFLVAAILASSYALCTGTGAAFLTRFGYREYYNFHDQQPAAETEAPAPAPPPIREIQPAAKPLPTPDSPNDPPSGPPSSADGRDL